MATRADNIPASPVHPLHAFLLAGSFPLFLGALLSDWAYSTSFQIQWKNFASWLLVGALVFAGLALLWAFVDALRSRWRRQGLVYFLLLLGAWLVGLFNALTHAKDSWASMPDALILSVIAVLLILAANWIRLSGLRSGAHS